MRLAVCALSAVLLSGCSWLGMGGGHSDSYGYDYGYAGNGCAPAQAGYGMQGYGVQGAGGMGCAPGAGYGVAGAGYGTGAGYGAGGMGYGAGAGAGYGAGGMGYGAGAGTGYGAGGMGYGVGAGAGYGAGGMGYGAGGVTTLSGAAPYGTALGGTTYGASSVYGGSTVGGVQTVQGAPIYVNQPYAVPYGVPTLRGASYGGGYGYGYNYGGGAMPFGVELFSGTDFDIDGDLFGGKSASPNNEDLSLATAEVTAPQLGYDDAFGTAKTIGGAIGYDLNRNTTLLGQVSYTQRDGESIDFGTFTPGSYNVSTGAFTASGPAETVHAEFTDLEEFAIEGGVRQYLGHNSNFRPYVGATAGFAHNNSVDVTQSTDTTLTPFTQEYIASGWSPTASGVVGAEMAVGHRAAIGVETGLRWKDSMDTNVDSDSRISIPLSLRGRVAF